MPTITLRDVPEDLHHRLQQQAIIHHRPIDTEVIVLLEALLAKGSAPAATAPEERLAAIMEISRRCAALPELDPRSADDIVGYDENGWPA
ncbi:hypothetical protein [uncultured Thiodictyon sp.]|jgi:plasmid stability protein|uniref:FitA-like ribbon-helix-helix domain-containing protein n=1 Tax=uncultured Thiodictyon sp. TaxID=1846217 RepID=UPI0025D839D3|nr:hypothetical protein [uncultured Thiodictyon sp.]